ncbi:cell wall hydrolase [Sphingobium sp. AN641]|uniref:cell wall hydrolase n=1 Tax=Sphingobium sp. AN641 TaxID=3133443 RepID=UPI0030C0C228
MFERKPGGKVVRQALLASLALVALALPRLLPAAPLDMLAGDARHPDRTEAASDNFPGSAFFFAEGAFDPVPGARVIGGAHVLGLDEVKAAPASVFRGMTALDDYRALHCLTSAIYYEAGNEPIEGQRAVAQVVLNRVRSRHWPDSVCAVVYEGSERTDMRCQFTFSCDGSMMRAPNAAAWARSMLVARQALAGMVYAPAGLATHYHTLAVSPGWAGSLRPVAVIGAHIFYRMQGANGTYAAFATPYTGRELISGPARRIWPVRTGGLPDSLALPDQSTGMMPTAPETSRWTRPDAPARDDSLPQSTIRPEFRNTGRPLI